MTGEGGVEGEGSGEETRGGRKRSKDHRIEGCSRRGRA